LASIRLPLPTKTDSTTRPTKTDALEAVLDKPIKTAAEFEKVKLLKIKPKYKRKKTTKKAFPIFTLSAKSAIPHGHT
jgi:hypothetical protein